MEVIYGPNHTALSSPVGYEGPNLEAKGRSPVAEKGPSQSYRPKGGPKGLPEGGHGAKLRIEGGVKEE